MTDHEQCLTCAKHITQVDPDEQVMHWIKPLTDCADLDDGNLAGWTCSEQCAAHVEAGRDENRKLNVEKKEKKMTAPAIEKPARINHKGHGHPLTPEAREECRRAMRGEAPAKKKAKTLENAHFNVTVNGNKTIHRARTQNDVTAFVCTKKELPENHEVKAEPVTCKNCLKHMDDPERIG